MGFARKLSEEHESNVAWKKLELVYVINQPPESLESGSMEHLKDNCFGEGAARAAGEAKRTILLDRNKAFYGFLGTEEFSFLGQLARILSGYWMRMIVTSLWKYQPRGLLTALVDVRIGSAIWRGRTPGGVIVVDGGGEILLQFAESQPGDNVDFTALTSAVLALKK